MRISQKGIDFIKSHEKFKPMYYLDQGGKGTIGYGHTRTARPGMRVTREQADELAKQDIGYHEKIVNKLLDKVKRSQGQHDALVSFQYNTGHLPDSTLLKKINSGMDVGEAMEQEFPRWVHVKGKKSKGLINRRNDELYMANPEQDEQELTGEI